MEETNGPCDLVGFAGRQYVADSRCDCRIAFWSRSNSLVLALLSRGNGAEACYEGGQKD